MKLYNDIKQGSSEWHELRLGKLTASCAQAIAAQGKGLETLAFEKAAEIMTQRKKDGYKSEAMELGNEFESMARDSYEIETGNIVEQVAFVEMSEFVGCSPDGMVELDGLVEIKRFEDKNFVMYMYDQKIDTKYMWQMQMQMYVCNREWCDYVVFNENFEQTTIIERVERDDEKIDKIVEGLDMGVSRIKEILGKVQK